MGADLYYMDEKTIAYRERWRAMFAANKDFRSLEKAYARGYFRDSYNPSSVLWQMNLSWWRDITPLTHPDQDGNTRKPHLIDILALIRAHPVKGGDEQFRARRRRLMRFLSHAIVNDIPVHFSL